MLVCEANNYLRKSDMKNSKVDMLSGSIFKGLFAMTIPIMIMHVMQNMFSLIDMTVLGNLVNDTAVGAVGACSTLISLCNGLLVGISIGANVVIARHLGAKNSEDTEKAIGTAILCALAGGLLLLVVGVTFAETFLKLTDCPQELLPLAVTYFKIYFLGAPITMFYTFCSAILRAAGDTKRLMYFMISGGVVKITLNYVCITVFNLTVQGVALATIVSNAIAGSLAFSVLLRNKEGIRFNIKRFRFYGEELREIVTIGIPAGLQQALYSLANTVIVTAVNSFGADASTGVSIANQFDGILYQISCATAYATTPYIAQNLGAKNISRAKKAIVNGVIITALFGATFGSLSAIFSRQLSSVMSSNPIVIDYACQKMIIISSTYFICGINEVMGGTLRGVGKPIVPAISTLVFMCLIRFVWVYLIFPLCPNLTFLYLIWPIGWTLSIITQLIIFIPTIKKREKELSAAKGV